MSYTNKTVTWEACNPSNNIMDEYGDIVRVFKLICSEHLIVSQSALLRSGCILARKQPYESVIEGPGGKVLLTKSIFYVDPKVEPQALNIAKMDKLDGETIEQIYVMCDRSNNPKMIRFITV